MISKSELLDQFIGIRVWRRGAQRAPHKPLLILLMLGRVQRSEPRIVAYADVAEPLQRLLDDFGPPRSSSPAYPFYHLSSDGLWELTMSDNPGNVGSPSDRFLLDNNACGGFIEDVHELLAGNPDLVRKVAMEVLKQNFPGTLHGEILLAAGLKLNPTTYAIEVPCVEFEPAVKKEADIAADSRCHSSFRERILVAYSFRCAVCGFNIWLGRVPVALDAAHIKWHQAGGPDREENGLLLCTLHHKLFDRGVFSIDRELKVRVAETAHGGEGFEQWLFRFHCQPIRTPEQPLYKPGEDYIDWHVREVFRGPAWYGSK